MGRDWLLAAAVAFALAACGDGREQASASSKPEGPASAPGVETPFAVFREGALVIDRLGVPVPPPVTVGSTPSQATLTSDAPEIVSVLPDGSLVGRRAGRASIHAVGGTGQPLQVEVVAVSAAAISPDRLELRPGASGQMRLVAGSGEELPADRATWSSDAPEVALAVGGRIEASHPGVARITAEYGGVSATARVVVAQGRGPAFLLRPESPSLRVGDTVTFEALSAAGPLQARWSAGERRVLAQSGTSTFSASAAGRTLVCAQAGARSACTKVVVRR